MRKKAKLYTGKEITEDIINKFHLIAMKRYDEGLYTFLHEGIDTLEDMCYWHDTKPSEENIVLGEDWYIIYANKKEEIEIIEWVAIGDVKNKLEQSIEMFKTIKEILLLSKGKKVKAYMKHLTSYPFYTSFLNRGYLEEIDKYSQIEHELMPNSREIIKVIEKQYGSLSEYLKNNNGEYPEVEESIYHKINFRITNKFIKKYQK